MAGIGEALRSTREHRGLSIDQVAQDTRISPRFLEALEAEQFQELPAPVYVRGFLRSYANYLKIDPQPLLDNLVGGDMATPGATAGYVGANGRNGRTGTTTPRRTDPFQRSGVVPAARVPRPSHEAVARKPIEDDGWAPEPLGPFTPPHEDHGYIPGSDLMEAPEYAPEYEMPPEPVYTRRRTAGVLAERPPLPGEPGVPRRALVFGGAVLAIIAFLALAVLATRDGGDGNTTANAGTDGDNPAPTPGTVIPVGGAAGTATAAAAGNSATASASPSASTTSAASVTGTTTPSSTQTASAGGTATASAGTATVSPTQTAAPTQAPPTTTPTQAPPTATPTSVPVVLPENRAFGECTPTDGSYNCGPGPYRVICFAPLGFPLNSNWWVDVDRSFGAVPAGWREFDGLLTNGQIIKAGQTDCAAP